MFQTTLSAIVSMCVAAGGFKLWECAVDLAQYLCREYSLDKLVTSKTDPNFELVGKRVLELGCGQGLPGIVPLLAGAEVHFQASPSRYLASALDCMACFHIRLLLCVVLLALITSCHMCKYLQDFNKEVLTALTSQNVSVNRQRLPKSRRPVSARYFGGEWSSLGSLMASENLGGTYDMIISAETIYNLESQQQLFNCIKQVILSCVAMKSSAGIKGDTSL